MGTPAATAGTIALPQLKAFCRDAFARTGLSGPDADTGAEVLSTTDGWGVFTHGSKALRGYLRRLRAGGLRAGGRPGIVAEGPRPSPAARSTPRASAASRSPPPG